MAASSSDVRIPDTPARRFRTGERRREGHTAVSFFGTDPELNTPVVVKVFRPDAFPTALERQRIARELGRQVSVRHPSLARVIATGDEGGLLWVARDWIEGQPLHERVARGAAAPDDVARWTSQLAGALAELHRVMLLHRDVRPEHVILALDGRARLVDASCGRYFRAPDGKAVFGTPGFVAPEAISGKLVNARSDLYSLGATAFAMLEGAAPFGGGAESAVLDRQLRSDAPRATHGPDGLIAAVASMLAREPRERPFHAQQLEKQLEEFFTPTRATVDDEDGPPTAAVDQEMVARALAMQQSPSIVDDGFEDAEATEVGRPAAADSAGRSGAPPRAEPARGGTGAVRPPFPSPNTGAHAVAVAPSSAPVMSMGAQPTSAIRKATLVGIAPLPQPAPPPPSAQPAFTAAPSTAPRTREDSGSRASDGTSDFDNDEHTVVSEDSRIFGHSTPNAQSAHGSAVPPLPDAVANRVLQKGGTVNAPIEARPAGASVPPPPPPRTATGAFRAPAPAGLPAIPQPAYASDPESSGGGPTMTANVGAITADASTDNSGPNAAQSNPSITEPSGPSWDFAHGSHAAPHPPAAAPAYTLAHTQPAPYAQPPQHAPAAIPAPQQHGGYPPSPTGGYASPYPQQQQQPQYPGQPQPTGGYPSPQQHYGAHQPTGAYPSQGYPTAQPIQPGPNMSAAWPEQAPAKKALLWPWIAAGCLIAAVAGGTGYGLALRHRAEPQTESDAPPVTNPVATPTPTPTPNNAANLANTNPALVPPTNAAIDAGAVAMVPTIPVAQPEPLPTITADASVPTPTVAAADPPTNATPTPTPTPTQPVLAQTQPEPRVTNNGARAPTPPAALTPLQQARQLFTRRDYPAARAILESWVRSHPSDAQAFLLLGDVRFAAGERRPAGDAYRSAIAAGGYARPYWQRLVERQMSIGDRQGAINTLNDVLRHRPGDRDATRKLAELQGGGAPVPAFGAPRPTTIRR
jgi:serine/threonine protein kinase